jgi:hypothetical protein
MSETTLIANTGVQFIRIKKKLDNELLRKLKFVYFEDVDLNRKRFWLDELIYVPELDAYAKKAELKHLGLLSTDGKFRIDSNYSQVKYYHEGQPQVFEVGNASQVLRRFNNKWLPLPFFKNNAINRDFFGPTDWVRIFMNVLEDGQLEVILAVDTTVTNNSTISPEINDNPQENKFKLCESEDLILHYFDALTGCQWVEDSIKSYFEFEDGESQTIHIASYVFLIRLLKSLDEFPSVQLLSDNAGLVDVDLAIDIGNSKTCALLFENPNDLKFNLNKVKQLSLVDLTDPTKLYSTSFSTRLVFKRPDFGNNISELNQFKKFKWPSMVRIGEEAERVINNSNLDQCIRLETKAYNSSPKRYLWDTEPSEVDWNYMDFDNEIPESVYLNGISEQLNSDGTLCTDGVFGTNARYSRRSLMTFVFLEILSQANRQINSYEFRSSHGNTNSKRRIKRILISCPTAMIKEEQKALRQCANDAVVLFLNFNKVVANQYKLLHFENSSVEIIPSIKDLSFDEDRLESKTDWNYDEATSAQILYMFGAIKYKFDGNADLFFRLYGKNKLNFGEKKHVIVGSLDIGAGTSDLMICKYEYTYNDSTILTPSPLYWESFNYAGDELLKQVIQDVVIEGRTDFPNCPGVIKSKGQFLGDREITSKINAFFGKNNANIGYKARLMRVNFINQIGIPIANYCLSIANDKTNESINSSKTFKELFGNSQPNKELLKYFEKHFGFKFEDLVWDFSPTVINDIIGNCFSKLIEQISKVMHLYECDIVLLSGRPFSLRSLEDLLLKFHPVNSNRVVNLNRYWIGKWFPFSDHHGYINDPKTVVTVGTLLSMMGGKLFKLDNFRINDKNLRTGLTSTANYIGEWDNFIIQKSVMGKEDDVTTFTVTDIPLEIGFKNVDSANYPSRHLYTFQFNNKSIKTQLGMHHHIDSTSIGDALETKKNNLRNKLPYQITLRREVERNKEKLKLELIQNNEGEDVTKSNFELKLQTLDSTEEYWLDSGEFTLTIE